MSPGRANANIFNGAGAAAAADGIADALVHSARGDDATFLDAVSDGTLDGESVMKLIAPNGTTSGIGELPQGDIMLGAGRQSVRDESARLYQRLPPNNAPYRIGQAVFCYRDLPLKDPSADTNWNWLVVVTPRVAGENVHVVTQVSSYDVPLSQFATELAKEQARRAALRLQPLTDPFAVPDAYSGLISPQPKPAAPTEPAKSEQGGSEPNSEP
jgi:hypothetical protein